MQTGFMIAVCFLASVVGLCALIGAIVIFRVFLSALRLEQRVGADLTHRQQALNHLQGLIATEQRKLGQEKAALLKARKAAGLPPSPAEPEPKPE